MKLPEEIKKGLAYCDSRDHMLNGCAGVCPYWCDKYGCHSTEMKIDALAYIRQLEQRIVEADKTYSHWISVKERLPEPDQEVLLIAHGWKGQLLYIGRLHHEEAETSWLTGITTMESEWRINGWSYLKTPLVTHWMPLPELPELPKEE